jgi:hypothetical protein
MTAQDRLTLALRHLLDTGTVPPCALQPDLWTSEDASDRAEAARRCHSQRCPVIDQCADAADEGDEIYVWAGVDRGNQPRRGRR